MSKRKLLLSGCIYHLSAIASHCLFRRQNITPVTKVPFKNTVKIHSVFCDLEGSLEKHDNVIILKVMLPVPKVHFHCLLTRGNAEFLINVLQPPSLQLRALHQSLMHF